MHSENKTRFLEALVIWIFRFVTWTNGIPTRKTIKILFLFQEGNLPSLCWILDCVAEVILGNDGILRG